MGFTLEPLDYTITAAEPGHLEKLPRIELAAVSRFRGCDVPATLFVDTTPIAVFAKAQACGHLWVALATSGACVGFALVSCRERACTSPNSTSCPIMQGAAWAGPSCHRSNAGATPTASPR